MDRAGFGLDEAVEQPEEGRLPTAVRAEQGNELAASDVEGHAVGGRKAIEVAVRDIDDRKDAVNEGHGRLRS